MKDNSLNLLKEIIHVVDEMKGEDISILDFTDIENSFSDYFVICTGSSNTHVSAIAGKLEKDIRKSQKSRPIHIEGILNSQWVLLDYVNVIIHIFTKQTRDLYNIESLWGNIKRINYEQIK